MRAVFRSDDDERDRQCKLMRSERLTSWCLTVVAGGSLPGSAKVPGVVRSREDAGMLARIRICSKDDFT